MSALTRVTESRAILGTVPAQSASAAADIVSPSVDLYTKPFHSLSAILISGAIAAGGTLQLVFQDSADNSTFADVSGSATTALADTHDNGVLQAEIQVWNYPGLKRYVRAVSRQTGAVACLQAVVFMGHMARNDPASNHNVTSGNGQVRSTVVVP